MPNSGGDFKRKHDQPPSHNHKDLHGQFKTSQTTKPKTSSSKSKTLPSLQQQSVSQSFASVTPYDTTSKHYREITAAITRYLAKDMMPINTVTKDGFVSLITKLDRRYQIPSRTYFSQVAIPKMYDACRETMESELSQVEHYTCTTAPYISLTVHFLDQDFELKTWCLQRAYFPGQHTAENIACGLSDAGTCGKSSWFASPPRTGQTLWKPQNSTTGSDFSALAIGCILPLVSVNDMCFTLGVGVLISLSGLYSL